MESFDEIGTIRFTDAEGEEGVLIVRKSSSGSLVSLCLSMREGGDVETVLTMEIAREAFDLLANAIGAAQ